MKNRVIKRNTIPHMPRMVSSFKSSNMLVTTALFFLPFLFFRAMCDCPMITRGRDRIQRIFKMGGMQENKNVF